MTALPIGYIYVQMAEGVCRATLALLIDVANKSNLTYGEAVRRRCWKEYLRRYVVF